MMLSTLAVADVRVNRFFSFLMFASSPLIADERIDQIISKEVKQQIVADISIDKKTLETYEQDARDYYHDEIFPRITNLEHHILGSAINMISPKAYVIWTEGVAPGARGGNEFLYVISTRASRPKIVYSAKLNPKPSSTEGGIVILSIGLNLITAVEKITLLAAFFSTVLMMSLEVNLYKLTWNMTSTIILTE